MCGRYHFGINDSKKGRKIKERTEKLDLVFKTGDVFPGNSVLCVIPKGSALDLAVKKWGIKNKSFQINARLESIPEKISYKDMKENRCAVLCDGFYEWDASKEKYFITFNEEYMYLACIYNDDDELLIITREASEVFDGIHDRMPVILDEEEMHKYLNGEDYLCETKDLHVNKAEYEVPLF